LFKKALLTVIFSFLGLASQDADAFSPPKKGDFDRYPTAVFAGGCFWCMEAPFDQIEGVVKTVSGYTGGRTKDPSYKSVSGGGTGHLEAIQVVYDPKRVTYEKLLEVFWENVDPTDDGGQFCDRGDQYTTAIFYDGEEQQKAAKLSKEMLINSGKIKRKIVTPIRKAPTFYPAEPYHQDYYINNPMRYHFYRYRCGRDQRLEQLWGK
jgi:peptide-methionine (S)-S-oxide reductase